MKKYLFLILTFLSGSAQAATIMSIDRATFAASVSAETIGGEDFDSLTSGTILGVTPLITYSASLGDPIVTNAFLTSTFPNGLGSTSFGFFAPVETATIVFSSPITAFAIDINTFATSDGAYSALLDTGDIVTSLAEVFPNEITGQFIGFSIDTPFTQVTIATETSLSYTLDTLAFGEASALVPIPAAVWLFGSGLGFLGWMRRRKAT
jgi:hypothetical protein